MPSAEHACPDAQVPQLPPQPSGPQLLPVHFGWQVAVHWPSGVQWRADALQVPQLPPQPSEPHWRPPQLGTHVHCWVKSSQQTFGSPGSAWAGGVQPLVQEQPAGALEPHRWKQLAAAADDDVTQVPASHVRPEPHVPQLPPQPSAPQLRLKHRSGVGAHGFTQRPP